MTPGTSPSGAPAPEGSSFSLQREVQRKLLHLATAAVPIAYHYGIARSWIVGAFAAGTVVAFTVEWLRRNNAAVGARFSAWFGALLRPAERDGLTGATWLCLSCLVAVAFFPAPAAIAAMWCATIGDPAAAIVGRALSGHGGRKTWAGSAACLLFSALGVWWLTPVSPLVALAVGVGAAVAERPSGPLDDNVRVTALAGFITFLMA